MQKSFANRFADSFKIGAVALALGGGISILVPGNSGATLVGSAIGALVGSALPSRHANQSPTIPDPNDVVSNTGGLIKQDKVIAWFKARSIEVETYRGQSDSDRMLNRLAFYLGDKYTGANNQPILGPLLGQIRAAIAQNRNVQYSLKDANQQQITYCAQFCDKLHKDTLLSHYRYDKRHKVIRATVQDRSDFKEFLNGAWFERFVGQKVRALLKDLKLKRAYLANPFVRFADGDRFEFDLFFLIEDKPLLIECKTGSNYEEHLTKFEAHCRRLSLKPSQAFLIVLDLEDRQTEKVSKLWPFEVTNQNNFVPRLRSALA